MTVSYLDIETSYEGEITLCGIYIPHKGISQLIYKDISEINIMDILEGVTKIYTYNGIRFDIPMIKKNLGLDLSEVFVMHDLMYDCWKNKLYGGLKKVEKILGIERQYKEITGKDAPMLRKRFVEQDDKGALELLLEYNKEDIVNLEILQRKLLELDKQ